MHYFSLHNSCKVLYEDINISKNCHWRGAKIQNNVQEHRGLETDKMLRTTFPFLFPLFLTFPSFFSFSSFFLFFPHFPQRGPPLNPPGFLHVCRTVQRNFPGHSFDLIGTYRVSGHIYITGHPVGNF